MYRFTNQLKFVISAMTLILFFTQTSYAQSVNPKMVFENEKHDFGKIKEDAGAVSYTFTFTNTGAEAIVIQNVHASCGCTTPNWSNQPVLPGQKSTITATYNPLNRPGVFNKSITVTSNAENSPVKLYISGEVLKKEPKISDTYRYEMKGLRLMTSNLHVGDLTNTEKITKTIDIINDSETDIKVGFNQNRNMPAHLQITVKPETLKPQEKGLITITFDANKKTDWGYVYDRVYVNVNGSNDAANRITVSGTITEAFTDEQRANPPVMTFLDGDSFDFGKLKQGESVEHVYHFKNTGKSDLIIRKTKASCGCTAIAPKDKVIKPGQESSLKTVFNSRGKSGQQHKTVTITTNIPDTPSVIVKITGMVEVPKAETNTTNK